MVGLSTNSAVTISPPTVRGTPIYIHISIESVIRVTFDMRERARMREIEREIIEHTCMVTDSH